SSAGCFSGAPSQQCGLHSAYINGDVSFLNNQPVTAGPSIAATGQAGDARLAGFTSGEALCGPSHFCLVLDGSTGGDNAWAMMALTPATPWIRIPWRPWRWHDRIPTRSIGRVLCNMPLITLT